MLLSGSVDSWKSPNKVTDIEAKSGDKTFRTSKRKQAIAFSCYLSSTRLRWISYFNISRIPYRKFIRTFCSCHS